MNLGGRRNTLRTVAFGTVDGERWGVLIDAGETTLVIGDRAGRRLVGGGEPVTVDGSDWRFGSVQVTPAAVPVAAPDADRAPAAAAVPAAAPEWDGSQELCAVRGAFPVPAGAEPATCVGVRCTLEGIKLEDVGSLRLVAAWFSEAEAAALVALRQDGRAEHEHDQVTGALFDPDRWIPSIDPRLSTTYDGAGRPRRTNLELWIADGEDEYPRRVAGELAGPRPRAAEAPPADAADAITVELEPLVTHSRGHDGSGVYALVTLP